MRFAKICALLLPVIFSAPAANPSVVQAASEQTTVNNPAPTIHSDKKVSLPTSSIEKNKLNFTLEDCHRDGENVTCNIQFTNLANKDRDISLFADCSRIINGSQEFGGQNAQIGQSSSAILSAGVVTKGFITFQSVAADATTAKILELAYSTPDGDGTIRFSNIAIH